MFNAQPTGTVISRRRSHQVEQNIVQFVTLGNGRGGQNLHVQVPVQRLEMVRVDNSSCPGCSGPETGDGECGQSHAQRPVSWRAIFD